jgi:hypothetical protein
MHDKTLLFGALTATALAAGFGVYKARETPATLVIAPVTKLDAANIVRSANVPVRLTASDGAGLRLVSVKGSAAIEDPLALTELHLVFENPEDRVLEGTFTIALPRGASISRFAMKIGETWQEGEVVERQQARVAYEDFLHRRQDPALLEQSAGNEFSARVFPIPARGTKEIVIAYSETLEGGAPYVLPLKGLPALAAVDVDVRVVGGSVKNATFGLHQRDFAPADDFVVPATALPRSPGLRDGELLVARVVPFASSRPDAVESALVLVDTSASRALGLEEELRLVQRVLARLRPDARVSVAAFDQDVAPIYEGIAGAFGESAIAKLREREALGASDFQRALAWAGTEAKAKGLRRVILVGDGVATAGETDGQKIKLEVEKLRAAKIERIDAIAVGGIRDDAFLRSLVRGVLDKDGVILDGSLGADAIARRLGEATASGIPVKVEGATWFWPRTLDGLQAGDEIIVHAEVPPGTPVRIAVGGQEITPDLRPASTRPLLERSWAQAKIQSLIEAPTADAATTKRDIVTLGTRHRILSEHTAMLVLETDADYARFGIDRKATREVLSVQDGRIAVLRGSREPVDGKDYGVLQTATPASSSSASPRAGEKNDTARDPNTNAKGKPKDEPKGYFFDDQLTPDGLEDSSETTATKEQLDRRRTPTEPPKPKTPTIDVSGAVTVPPVTPEPTPLPSTKTAATVEGDVAKAPELKPPSNGGEARKEQPPPAPHPRPVATTAPRPKPVAPSGGKQRLQQHDDDDHDVRSGDELAQQQRPVPPTLPAPTATSPQAAQTPSPTTESPAAEAKPYEGRFKIVMDLLARGEKDAALVEARRWHAEEPGDILALVALGEALEAKGDLRSAARAYGSILELHPSRADSRRFAGERLERLADPSALRLAVDTFAKALAQRPDHPSSHRLYALALLRQHEYERAFIALQTGAMRTYPAGRFVGADRILREDLGLVAAAWTHAEPRRAHEIHERLRAAGGQEETEPSLRFVLVWETDANDVDFHIRDSRGGHAYYSAKDLPSGGSLYSDVTTGYGPECFTVRKPVGQRAYPYTVQANYFARGPMGYGMGKLELVEHDGKGNLTFDERPFVVMADHAYIDLGAVSGPIAAR